MASDDKILYLLVGAVIGIPLGMVLFKYLFSQQPNQQAAQAAYGFNYVYDANGNLTSYTPVPLNTQNAVTITKMTAASASVTTTDNATEGLFLT